jgi:hypothetical protein
MNAEPSTARAAAPVPSTAASFTVRSRALRALEEHRAGMSRSAELVARSRALCEGRAAAVRGDAAAGGARLRAALEPVAPRAPTTRRSPAPRLRLLSGGAPSAAPAPAPACMHLGCSAPATVAPRIVVRFATHEVSLPGLPLRVCPVHAEDLAALARTDAFQQTLRGKLRRRGHEEPVAVRFAFLPLQ